ncbi:MAG: sugar isomerase [Pseudopedobacter saltans]|uniref:Sugar isomerase n=1 Tax=Pseudopedobacter saltans TaxID=151895 RepID=A0A2W5EI39_9SPHI|nr:MAG: sugar isomerase [Pseudopedobacter saltans]
MILDKEKIDSLNTDGLTLHQKKIQVLKDSIPNFEEVISKLVDFQIAIPSWALGTGGTRFGRFAGTGEPRNIDEKLEDVALLNDLTKSCNSISLHIPWDIPQDYDALRAKASDLGLHFDAVNSNTFQDQKGQDFSYKFGSLHHVNKDIRQKAIEHNIEVIQHGDKLGSKALSLWLSDGSDFPGELNFRGAFERTLESLQEIYKALPNDWKFYIEYKCFEPHFYSTTIADWGQSYLLASKLGPKAVTLVDLGHHLPGANIEQIVSLLLMEDKLAGFHFNDSKYSDDDLTAGSINPYQLFLIFHELVEGLDHKGKRHATDIGWMIDASHNVKDPIEDLLQSVEAIKLAYAQALIIDQNALTEAQNNNKVALAQEIIQDAYRTDVRPLLAEARLRSGAALSPIKAFNSLDIRNELVKERGLHSVATGL